MRMTAEVTEDTGGKRLALVASCAGIFLAILRSTSVNTALPEIGADLGGALSGLQWVVASYTLVLASLLMSVGRSQTGSAPRGCFWLGLSCLRSFRLSRRRPRHLGPDRLSA